MGAAAARADGARAGVLLTFAVCAALAVYYATTWHEPHRRFMAALVGAGVASGILVEFLPTRQIIRSR